MYIYIYAYVYIQIRTLVDTPVEVLPNMLLNTISASVFCMVWEWWFVYLILRPRRAVHGHERQREEGPMRVDVPRKPPTSSIGFYMYLFRAS